MSYPRKKLDLNMLILERRSCEAMEYAAKLKNPKWSFERFEALHFGIVDDPEAGDEYDTYRVLSQAEEYLDELDRQIPFLHPLERGTHYAWELFIELPRVGSSRSTRQLWNRLARAMSEIELPVDTDEFVDQYGELLQGLLKGATDMGDRFYLAELDYGGWDGGIISKDFLIEGLQMLVAKLKSPVHDRSAKEKNAAETEAAATTEVSEDVEVVEETSEVSEDVNAVGKMSEKVSSEEEVPSSDVESEEQKEATLE